MKKIGIIQPGRVGDIICLLPAMRYLKETQNAHIIWPIFEQFIWMFTEVTDFITFVPLKSDVYTVVKDSRHILKNIYKCDEIIDIAATFPDSLATADYVANGDGNSDGDGKVESFDMFKYRKLNVPIEEKWKLNNVLIRNRLKEDELFNEKVKEPKYAVAFLSCSKGRYNVPLDFAGGQLIDVDEKSNLFHWIKILENAQTIVTLNSGPLILVEHLNLSAKRILLKVPNTKLPLLKNKWTIRCE